MNKEKQYFEDNSKGEFFFSSNYIHQIYDKIINGGVDTYQRYSKIMSDNRSHLKDTIGKHSFCTIDSSNRRVYVWKRELPSGCYWILTARERGTTYEIDATVDLNEVLSDILSIFNLSDLKNDILSDVDLKKRTER